MIDLEQRRLEQRFTALRTSRSGPVFFIEHGLVLNEHEDFLKLVKEALSAHELNERWWKKRSLPLIVAATEVGYQYRGAGTDFWPVLGEILGVEPTPLWRQLLRDLFSKAAAQYRGARPPKTAWADMFCLIAWPITHALVPLEFHLPLASTLLRLRRGASHMDDAALYRAVRSAASISSARFATLLEDEGLVVAVTRSLLGGVTNELSTEIINRITQDLEADPDASRSVAAARQRSAHRELIVAPVGAAAGAIRGIFRLRHTEGVFNLEASFPPIEQTLADQLRRSLRRRRFAPKLWGVSARVPSDQLLSGLPFSVRLPALPAADTPLFPELSSIELDDQERTLLQRFELHLELPLVFAVSTDGTLGRQVRGGSITGHRSYWALLSAEEPMGLPGVELGPFVCYEFDPTRDAGAEALKELELHVRFGVSVRFAGAPAVGREEDTPVFCVGDARLLAPLRSSSDAPILVEINGSAATVDAAEIARITVREGAQLLRVSNWGEHRDYALRGVSAAPAPAAPLQLDQRSAELTVQALLSGRLSFLADSFAPLEGLELTIELEVAGRTISATGPLGQLPQRISSEHPVVKAALDEGTVQLLSVAASVTLSARIGHLCYSKWTLERQLRPCWWELKEASAAPALMSELGAISWGIINAATPHLAPTAGAEPVGDAWLLAPLLAGTPTLIELNPAAPFTALCLTPARVPLAACSINKPQLVRRRRGTRSNVGLEDLMEGYLRWELAETRTLIGELRRRQSAAKLDMWIVELCCAEEWATLEAPLRLQGPWELLYAACAQENVGRDTYIKLSPEHEREITRLAVEELRRSSPELWTRVSPSFELSHGDYEALDGAFAHAYELFAEQRRRCGDLDLVEELEDADPGNAPEEWEEVLDQVAAEVELRPLAALLLPTEAAAWLMSFDVTQLSAEEVSEELFAWASTSATRKALAGASPKREVLQAAYSLWVEPEAALMLDWRGALDTLIAERVVARAVRYLALRARAARRGDGR